jgi:hypothetical protein
LFDSFDARLDCVPEFIRDNALLGNLPDDAPVRCGSFVMPKLNWAKNTKTVKALNKALSSLPNGIEKRQSMFQTWVERVNAEIDWVSSTIGRRMEEATSRPCNLLSN